MISRHSGIPVDRIDSSLEWEKIIVYLSLALEYQEQEDYRVWILSQNDPKKFRWTYRDVGRRPLTPEELGRKVVQFAREKLGARPRKGDVWDYARARGIEPVIRIERDGKESFVDSAGKEVEVPKGHFFIPSRHPDAQKLADKVGEG